MVYLLLAHRFATSAPKGALPPHLSDSAMTSTRSLPLLVLIGLVTCVTSYDYSSIAVAAATIRDHLGFSNETAPWIMSIYTLMFGGFLLLGGRVGDLYGRCRVLLTGALVLAIFSLLGAAATTDRWFLVFRAIKGIGGALLVPNTLALLNALFEEGPPRNMAFGVAAFAGEFGYSSGNLLGGVLTEYDWRGTIALSGAAGLLIFCWGLWVLPWRREKITPGKFDLLGAIFSILALGSLLMGIMDTIELGWTSSPTLTAFGISACCFAVFFWRIFHHPSPLLPPELLRNRNVLGAGAIIFLLMGCGQGAFFQIILLLQGVMKYSPAAVGEALFPLILASLAAAFCLNRLLDWLGFRLTIALSLGAMTMVMAWLMTLGQGTTYSLGFLPIMISWSLAFPIACGGTRVPAGFGVHPEKQGIAYGVHFAAEQIGMTFGVNILATIAVVETQTHGGPDSLSALVYGFRVSMLASTILTAIALALGIFVLKAPQTAKTVALPESVTAAA